MWIIKKEKPEENLYGNEQQGKVFLILLKVLQEIHDDHPNLHEYLDKSMVDICREENVSPHQVFFSFCLYDNLSLVVFCYAMTYQHFFVIGSKHTEINCQEKDWKSLKLLRLLLEL